jgi:hypothetical protein
MSNLRLNWVLPTTRVGGEALLPEQIKFVEIKMSADGGLTYNGLVQAPPSVLEHLITDADPGTYHFKGVVQDIDGRRSTSHDISTTNPGVPIPTAPPSELPTFTVVVE